jgi:hypothetical protein
MESTPVLVRAELYGTVVDPSPVRAGVSWSRGRQVTDGCAALASETERMIERRVSRLSCSVKASSLPTAW